MKPFRNLLLLAFFIVAAFCSAQDKVKVERLKKFISSAPEDSLKVDSLIELSGQYLGQDNDQALKNANEAKNIAGKIKFESGKAWALKKIGQVYNFQGDYVKALQAWKEALSIFESIGNKVGASNMLNNIGVIYYNKSLEDSAQDYYLRSLKVAEEIKDTLRIATALANVGGIYSNKKETFSKALEFHHRALALGIAIGDTGLISNSNSNIGEAYLSKSIQSDTDEVTKNRDLDSSLTYLLAAKEIIDPETSNLAYTLNNIGKVYRQKHNYERAIQFHREAYDAAKNLEAKLDMAQALLGIAQTDTSKHDYKSAIDVYKEAESLLKEIGQEATYDLQYVYEGLSKSYANMKDYQNAFMYQRLLVDVIINIYTLETQNKLGTALFGYEVDKQQGEINLQKEVITRQKLIRNGFIGGFISAGRNKSSEGSDHTAEINPQRFYRRLRCCVLICHCLFHATQQDQQGKETQR